MEQAKSLEKDKGNDLKQGKGLAVKDHTKLVIRNKDEGQN